jgi:cyclase
MRTLAKVAIGLLSIGVFLLTALGQPGDGPPAMKFNDVRQVAPGVFFRYSAISATDPSVVFGGCNNTWVVFKDYVVVIDANFPKEAGDVLAAIKKTTDKPVRYVLDTHHHGDHAYGNAVWSGAGAKIVGQTNCARLLRVNGPKAWADAAKGRKDVAGSELKVVDMPFDDEQILDDGTQRVEFRYLGHAHTAGDAVAYLPKHKILCTGDACVNGAFNFMGHSNSASWIKCLDKMEQFDVKLVCPGHGPLAGKDLFARQKRYFQELREQVKKGIDAGKPVEEITRAITMPWYKEWTGKEASAIKDNVDHVFKELTGKIDYDRIGRLPVSPLAWPAISEPVGFAAGNRGN